MTRSCTHDEKAITALIKKIDQQYSELANLMAVMAKADAKHLKGKIAATDCTKYATPEPPVDTTPATPTTTTKSGPQDGELVEASWYSSKKSTASDSTDDETDPYETEAERIARLQKERAAREVLRKHKLARCHRAKAALKARVVKVTNDTESVSAVFDKSSKIVVKAFPSSLHKEMKEYDHGAKVALKAGR